MEERMMPFDILNKSRGKRVILELKNKKQIAGTLKAWDQHVNIVLDDAEEREEGETKRTLGTIFIRGDMIIFVSPA